MGRPMATEAIRRRVHHDINGDRRLLSDMAFVMRLPWWRMYPRRLAILAVAVVVAVLLGVVLERQRAQIAALRRQQEQTGRQRAATCTVFADIGRPRLITPRSSELGRKIVLDAAAAARILGCGR